MLAKILLPCLLMVALLPDAAAAQRRVTDPEAPRSLPVDGTVDVRWTDPAQFSDIRYSTNRREAERGDWVVQLAEHLRQRALKRLPAGERLEVEITDIRRAGSYEPWHGLAMNDVRIMRDHYPPRMELHFQRIGADGQVIEEGDRKLMDAGYLMGSSSFGSDPLRYEKAMLDRWLVTELDDSTRIADR